MNVREHASKHDTIDDLPLVTKTASVIRVDRQDRDRRAEAVTAVERALASRGLADDYPSVTEDDGWERLRDALRSDGRHRLLRRVTALAERVDRPTPTTVSVRFRTGMPLAYLAGQYVGVRYHGSSRAYSLSSSPTRPDAELCVRRVPGGRLSPHLCESVAVGDHLTVRGPHGDLVLGPPSSRDLVFLATGTGVAPFKGMIEYAFDTGLDEGRDVWLFLGAAWEDDLPYREQFREYAADRDSFHFVPCLSREPYLSDWDGETDYVQHALLKHVDPATVHAPVDARVEQWLGREPDSGVSTRLDPSNADVYACGTNAMVHGLVDAAERVGVPRARIECEGFG